MRPLPVPDIPIGGVLGTAPDGDGWRLAVSVLGEANYGYEPRVKITVGPRKQHTVSADWWFIEDQEVQALLRWLRDAAAAAAACRGGEIGALSGLQPSCEQWLSVRVVPAPPTFPGGWAVQVQFDDQMLRDDCRLNAVSLSARSARALASLLKRALETAARHPARIIRPEAPR